MIHARQHPAQRARRGLPLRAVGARSESRGAGRAIATGKWGERAGFTLIELLVVIAIIILLLSMLALAVTQASRTAQKASTQHLMDSMKKGLVRFKEDIGYYPPMLGPSGDKLRDLFNAPLQSLPAAQYQAEIQDWYSTCALADYLLGWDVGLNDGYGYPAQNELPPAGIRHPDTDGVWGGTLSTALPAPDGSLASRNPPFQGKVLGPYLELKDERLLAGVIYDTTGQLQTYFMGDVLPAGVTWDSLPKAIVDYWGLPIRYYRRPYAAGALSQSHRPNTDINNDGNVDGDDIVPTLSDIYLLRPWTIKPGSESVNRFADDDGKSTTTRDLDAAEFALFSSGPDKSYNDDVTVDPDEYNKDNIVEVGP